MSRSALLGPASIVGALFLALGAQDAFGQTRDYVDSMPQERGNVLVLLIDDLGVNMVEAYQEGPDTPLTPNIDTLASNGILFRNAWSNPVCSATRAALLTGRYGFRTGVGYLVDVDTATPQNESPLLSGEITIPEMLDLGTHGRYDHAAIGKWHLNTEFGDGLDAPRDVGGFRHYAGVYGNLEAGEDYYAWTKTVNGQQSLSTNYITTEQVDDAIAWIRSAAQAPWFLYVAFTAAHAPLGVPPWGLYSEDLSNAGMSPRSHYKATVEALDTEIGRLINGIPSRIRSKTTIFLLGDNGTPSWATIPPFDPNKAKNTLFEGGVNVPFIVAGAQVTNPGRECQALINVSDLFATVAEIAGVNLGQTIPGVKLDSVSLVPYLDGTSTSSIRDFVLTEKFKLNSDVKAVRNGRFKLMTNINLGVDILFDLVNDPFEQDDLLALGLTPGSVEETAYLNLKAALNQLISNP